MNKLPHKCTIPHIVSSMMLTMLLGMPAIMTYRNLPEGATFMQPWLDAIAQTVPSAFLMAIVAGTLTRLFVTKVLVEAKID